MAPIFIAIEALMECVLPFIMSALVDSIKDAVTITPTHPTCELNTFSDIFKPITYLNKTLNISIQVSVFGIIMILIGMCIISIISGIFAGRASAKASVGLSTNLRSDLYKKIQSFSFANIDKFSTSSLVTRLTTDVNNVQMSFEMLLRIVVRAPLMMLFSAIMAFVAGGVMALIFVVLIPITGFGLFLIIKNAMKIFIKVFKRYDKLNESVQENVSGIRVVKSYVREDFEKQKFNNASNDMTNDFIKVEKIVALNNPLINTSIHLSIILILSIGSYFIWKSTENSSFWAKLTIGQLSSLITYGVQILMSVMMISMILVMLTMSLECIRRIHEVLIEEPTIKNCENPIYNIDNGDIVFKHVDFKYKDNAEKNALSDINLNIKSGQFIGVLGSTGSGKTSFINLISRLYDVSNGEVLVSGKNVKEYDIKSLRNSVSVVLQKNVLFSGTIESNLKWGNENATIEQMTKACEIAQAMEFINTKPEGFSSLVEQGGNNFSGGQKQRLCIARAILKEPKIMILDDSTSAVDTKTDKLIQTGLKEQLPHMTKIIIAQRISSIEHADQIIVMDDGKISDVGTHKELLKRSEIYKDVYQTQNRVGVNK